MLLKVLRYMCCRYFCRAKTIDFFYWKIFLFLRKVISFCLWNNFHFTKESHKKIPERPFWVQNLSALPDNADFQFPFLTFGATARRFSTKAKEKISLIYQLRSKKFSHFLPKKKKIPKLSEKKIPFALFFTTFSLLCCFRYFRVVSESVLANDFEWIIEQRKIKRRFFSSDIDDFPIDGTRTKSLSRLQAHSKHTWVDYTKDRSSNVFLPY